MVSAASTHNVPASSAAATCGCRGGSDSPVNDARCAGRLTYGDELGRLAAPAPGGLCDQPLGRCEALRTREVGTFAAPRPRRELGAAPRLQHLDPPREHRERLGHPHEPCVAHRPGVGFDLGRLPWQRPGPFRARRTTRLLEGARAGGGSDMLRF